MRTLHEKPPVPSEALSRQACKGLVRVISPVESSGISDELAFHRMVMNVRDSGMAKQEQVPEHSGRRSARVGSRAGNS